MNFKNILSVILALVAGYFLIKILWWMIGVAFSIALGVIQIVFLVLLAIPLYIIISRTLLK